MENAIQKYTPENLPLITYKDKPVVTTEMLAVLYGTDPTNIRKNFSKNSERFIEGKHFFKLEGDDLQAIRERVTESNAQISTKTRVLNIWTERGAARHAKILETDQAWEVFEKLEDFYFGKQDTCSIELQGIVPVAESAMKLAGLLGFSDNQQRFFANELIKKETGFDLLEKMGATALIAPDKETLLTPTELGEQLGGMSPRETNNLLELSGLQTSWYSTSEKNGKKKKIKNWQPTDIGAPFCEMLDTKKQHSDGTMVKQVKWKHSVIQILEQFQQNGKSPGLKE